MRKPIACLCVLLLCAAGVQAAFIVEPHSSGLAPDHFSHNGPTFPAASTKCTALGLIATNSVYGGSAVAPVLDTYTFAYTPGADADNFIVPLDNRYFGNGQYSTNLTGGQTGYYNVYITWPAATNVSAECTITVANDGADVVWYDINMNDGQTVAFAQDPIWGPFPVGTIFYGGNNRWLQIADEVLLTAGQTYTVSQVAESNTFVSMRSAGVMWEFVAVPEPASMLLLGLGGLLLRKRS